MSFFTPLIAGGLYYPIRSSSVTVWDSRSLWPRYWLLSNTVPTLFWHILGWTKKNIDSFFSSRTLPFLPPEEPAPLPSQARNAQNSRIRYVMMNILYYIYEGKNMFQIWDSYQTKHSENRKGISFLNTPSRIITCITKTNFKCSQNWGKGNLKRDSDRKR